MGYRYKFVFDPPLKQLAAAFGLMSDKLGDFRPVWGAVADIAGAGMQKNIQQEGRPIGADWPDPTKDYARDKSLRGFGKQPLQQLGNLLSAFSDASVLKQNKKWALFGIDGKEASYGKVLHAGRRPKGKLVKGAKRFRHYKFAEWSPEMIKAYDRLLGKYVEGILDKAVEDMRRG